MARLMLKDGTPVPGATTICNLLNKEFLIKWANKLGKQGIDVTEYVDIAARKGTLIHSIIESHNTKKEIDLSEYSDDEIDLASKIFYTHYIEWEKLHEIQPLESEFKLVSETYKFGGIIDFYAILDGVYTVIDFKTSKSISKEHLLQVSSYVQLLKENGYKVDQLLILDVKKDLNLKIDEKYLTIDETLPYWELFKKLLDVYYLKKQLNWN